MPDSTGENSGRDPVEFSFQRCSYTVKAKGGDGKQFDKKLVDNVSAHVVSGHMLAIMGPSGAGKSTLLNMLTLEKGTGVAEGNVTLGGQRLTPKLFAKHCSYVPQFDQLWTFLTTKEHLAYAYAFFRPAASRGEKEELMGRLLRDCGMESCANTKAGGGHVRGLSGGQRRRLSLMLAFTKSPALVVLDEPTSGLDSAASANVMATMKRMAPRMHVAIVCTIHQPSAKVFEGFDDTLILSGGRLAYFGPAAEMGAYMKQAAARLGRTIAEEVANPAELMLDLVNKDFTEKAQVDALLDLWANDHAATIRTPLAGALVQTHATAGLCSQLATLLKRHTLLCVRDYMLYVGRMFFFLVANFFFSVIYWKARDRDQDQAAYRLYLCMWFGAVPTAMGVAVVFVLNQERFAIEREVKDGMYSAFSYIAAHTVLQFVMMFILSVFALGVPAYAMADFYADGFGWMLLVYATMLWGFESLAQLESVRFDTPVLGMLEYLNVWFLAFLFAGVVIDPSQVVWPFRTLAYILPFRWGFAGIAYTEYAGTSWSGAVSCPANLSYGESYEAGCPGAPYSSTLCMGVQDSGGLFCCPGVPNSAARLCQGATGAQILDTLNILHKVVENEDQRGMDIGLIIAITAVFKLLFTVLLWRNCNPHTRIKEPPPLKALRESLKVISTRASILVGVLPTNLGRFDSTPAAVESSAGSFHDLNCHTKPTNPDVGEA